jgi:UDP-3-O-[3-hydroxymyristoyl] N-acetylglucosamine deacetylase
LIRGASSDNCVVLTKDGVENPPLRFADEFVRHKVLDLIGDLALLLPLQARLQLHQKFL